jgi:hypothetical protein
MKPLAVALSGVAGGKRGGVLTNVQCKVFGIVKTNPPVQQIYPNKNEKKKSDKRELVKTQILSTASQQSILDDFGCYVFLFSKFFYKQYLWGSLLLHFVCSCACF